MNYILGGALFLNRPPKIKGAHSEWTLPQDGAKRPWVGGMEQFWAPLQTSWRIGGFNFDRECEHPSGQGSAKACLHGTCGGLVFARRSEQLDRGQSRPVSKHLEGGILL